MSSSICVTVSILSVMLNKSMLTLNSPLTVISGIGEKRAKAFKKLGVSTLYDLLSFFPRRYEDRSKIKPISLCGDGETSCISVIAADEPRLVRIRHGMELVKFRVADESGIADITYFNQNWMKNNIVLGGEYIFYGKMEVKGKHHSMSNPMYEPSAKNGTVTGHIFPVYRLCHGLTQNNVLQSMRAALDSCVTILPERIPQRFLAKRQLACVQYAYQNIHFPADFHSLELSRKRLVYEELFLFSCAVQFQRGTHTVTSGLFFSTPDMREFYAALPYLPTNAQKRAIEDALYDFSSGKVMNRLVQGDVGSGKTLVAAALIWCAFKNHAVSAFMAPTEILAQQHAQTLTSLLSPFGLRICLLTGSMLKSEKKAVRDALKRQEIDLIIGTHALFTENVEYPGLGLVITDEQHRFGVQQRSALISKGKTPHVLVMSATPIPRTLALILYGDLDVSILDEMPPGRQAVDTFVVDSRYRARLNAFIHKQAEEGHQSFIICPMVDDTEEDKMLQLHSAESQAKTLQLALPDLRISCVHGKMKPKDKNEIMAAFSAGKTDVLVSTTVVEVGVDVPNATLMIIENAERFGLSQLHQLRGRVGRGTSKSFCVLVSDSESKESRERLNILCKTNDGFQIAEEDLRLRGPGDFFGSRQHGLPEMHVANLCADTEVLKTAKEDADSVFQEDPDLSLPEHLLLKERVLEMLQSAVETWN